MCERLAERYMKVCYIHEGYNNANMKISSVDLEIINWECLNGVTCIGDCIRGLQKGI